MLTAALRTHRDRAMVAAMVLGGLRRCEVLGLRLEDLRFGERRVFIAEGKGGHQRLIPVSPRFFAEVSAYLDAERPVGVCTDRVFVVLKGPRRGQPLLHAGVADLRMWDAQVADSAAITRLCAVTCAASAGRRWHRVRRTPTRRTCSPWWTSCACWSSRWSPRRTAAMSHCSSPRRRRSGCAWLVLVDPLAELAEPDQSLRGLWQEEERLVEEGDLDGATDLNVRAWLGPDADLNARELVRTMQRDALAAQVAAGEVDSRELPVTLESLTMPVRLFVGLHDRAFFVEIANELARQLPDARLVELPWAGHLPSLERPAEMARLVRDALGGTANTPDGSRH